VRAIVKFALYAAKVLLFTLAGGALGALVFDAASSVSGYTLTPFYALFVFAAAAAGIIQWRFGGRRTLFLGIALSVLAFLGVIFFLALITVMVDGG